MKAQTCFNGEIMVDNFAGGGRPRANLPEWAWEKITTMARLEQAVAV